ncbi:uncharacterized protein LOC116771137 isoform X1 [Danaus plexippus]|uniref:uncharacterized protein LOC116771137 isoform X1 n=1 Tax=Danaus plexippus TaxID=13037 RepID=UPI002AB1412C|nr:uncharacterized protein LOC116771137 isoform X1 [Danaus plexippus]
MVCRYSGGMENGKLDRVPTGPVHLDTVRSLHQTVVSLRTALETSKNELQELKQKYQRHSHCIEYEDIIEKLTLENHILRRKIIDSGCAEDQNLFEAPNESTIGHIEDNNEGGFLNESEKQDYGKREYTGTKSKENLEDILEEQSGSVASDNTSVLNATSSVQGDVRGSPAPEIKEDCDVPKSFKTKLELLSKFDVRIKVKTLKDGSVISSTTSDSESTIEEKTADKTLSTDAVVEFKEHREHFEDIKDNKGDTVKFKASSTENIKMAVPNEAEVKSKSDKFDVQVRITSEDSLVVKESIDRDRRKDTLNLDVDNLSLRSLSEGDNSVFYEGGTTPQDPNSAPDDKQEQENVSGNESEEVDDIELIFTTDESKDISNLQEDLVSIQETDNWTPALSSSTHSTPVLIKFHTLDPDFQPGSKANEVRPEIREHSIQRTATESSLRMKRISLPSDKDIRHVGFKEKGTLEPPSRGILKSYDNRSDNLLYRKSPNTSTRRLDSVDSLTSEYRGLSFDNTKSSSFELGSSLDVLHRDESISNFNRNRMGHRYSVFAATDISKCGTSQDDLASNLNARRNTCPNPFQYGLSRGLRGRKPVRTRVLHQGFAPRRESAAQTDLSALPPRWTSDGYLAYKTCVSPGAAPTLPQRTTPRRPLLSDLGFTSMVPELSRSAEPLWVRRVPPSPCVPSCGPTLHPPSGLEPPRSPLFRYRYRSPNISLDRNTEWTPPTYATPKGVWRGSLPDVRHDDTDELLRDTEVYLRRSIDNLRSTSLEAVNCKDTPGQPYIPSEARHLRLGHAVKLITSTGRLAVGRVRYVGLAGGTAANSSVVVGAEFALNQYPGIPLNDGTYNGRKYFVPQAHHTALFVPFSKVVMAWAN